METEPAGPKVLVVDDDEYVTSVVERALRRDGYRMATAADGERGLQLLREWRPDAAILDIVMPGLDGLALCRRARSERPDLGILILTARDDSADQIVGLDAGADDYLVKPFSLQVLAARHRLLLQFMRTPGRVLSKSELNERVWGNDLGGSDNVIEVYVGYLRGKLEAGGEPRLIQTLRGAGYILRPVA